MDDAVLSCGLLMARFIELGSKVNVISIFTEGPNRGDDLEPFAKGLLRSAWLDVSSSTPARRREDRIALSRLGAKAVHFGQVDAAFRRNNQGRPIYKLSLIHI